MCTLDSGAREDVKLRGISTNLFQQSLEKAKAYQDSYIPLDSTNTKPIGRLVSGVANFQTSLCYKKNSNIKPTLKPLYVLQMYNGLEGTF